MANEIQWSAIKSAVGREYVARELLGILTDQYYIESHPCLLDVADLSGSGAEIANIRDNNLNGAAAMTDLAEGGTYANSAFSANKYPVTVSQRYSQFNVSDLAKAVAPGGELDAAAFASDAMKRRARTWTRLIAVAQASFTAAHTMSSAPTVDDLMTACQKLELAYAAGEKMAILEPHQYHAIQQDASFVQAMNVASRSDSVIKMMELNGFAYKGRFTELNLDIFVSFYVTTASSKYVGAIFTRGGIIKAKATPVADTPDTVVIEDMSFAQQASSTKPETLYRSSIMAGVAIAQDAAGIKFLSPT